MEDFVKNDKWLSETNLIPPEPRQPTSIWEPSDNLSNLVVKEVDGSVGYGMLIGPKSSKSSIEEFRRKLSANPRGYIGQPLLDLSFSPTLIKNQVEGRRVDLRPFCLMGENAQLSSGGLTRVAMNEGSFVVNSSQGGGVKDTWVLAE